MKKCASCTKDLPDAALHCVFCGAKQPLAPATTGGMAKTVMGAYSASDMMDHLKQQGHPPPPAPSFQPPRGPQPPPAAFPPAPAPPPPLAAPHNVPSAGANAKTVFAGPPQGASPGFGGGPAPAGAFGAGGGPAPAHGFGGGAPLSNPIGTTPSHASSVPLAAPVPQPAPVPGYAPNAAPIPSAAPPYLANQAARAGRPIEPWKDSLRLMMFVWGGVLLAAFATPLTTDPLVFNWDIIANAEGAAKLPPLIMAAVGVLSLAIAGIPMSPVPRGMIAGLLGLAGVLVPLFVAGDLPPWQMLLPLVGSIVLIPSLFVRDEYRDASLPRIAITVGVVASLLPYLVPVDGRLPLVEIFKGLIEAPGELKVIFILVIAYIALLVLCLLAWMPSPASGGAKVFAWLLILWPVIVLVIGLVLSGNISNIGDAPGIAVSWVAGVGAGGGKEAGMMALLGMGLGVAYAVLIGYGLATVIGKKLE